MNNRHAVLLSLLITSTAPLTAKTDQPLWNSIEQDFQTMQKHVDNMMRSMKAKFADVEQSIGEPTSKIKRTDASRVTAHTSTEKNTYRIALRMPEFSQENIKVTLEANKKGTHVVIIEAKKAFQAEEKTNDNSIIKHSESYASQQLINNKQQIIQYKDGVLVAKFDLPENINIDTQHDMAFEDEMLTISFPLRKHTKESKKRTLSLTSK